MINDDARKIFAKNLSDYAKSKGLNQSEIALKIGCSSSTVSDWFSGNKYPRPDKMQSLADMLGVYISDLTNEKTIKNKPLVNNDEELTEYLEYLKNRPEMRMLFSVSKSCTKEEIEQAVRIIEALHKKDSD